MERLTKLWVLALAVGALSLGGEAYAAKKPSAKQVTGQVNLNQASAQQLDLLPGVGEKAAKRIIEYRQKTPFGRPEEIVRVKGFGKKKFEKLKAYLRVAGPTTLQAIAAGKADPGASAPVTPAGPAPQVQARSAPAAR
ncbi:MAG: helix-hairpin-helix domain-containing protein [Myxococcaceae bacterium]|nr:helix-hairpin-helix domain-containing protein [Myxococcaceae bacterium]